MPSGKYGKVTKVRVTTTLDIDTRERLERYSDISMINQSNIINKAVGDYLEDRIAITSNDVNYQLGEGGDVYVTYRGKEYAFSIIEGDDMGHDDYGERYVEIDGESGTIDTIQNAYNVNAFDIDHPEAESETEEDIINQIVDIINNYLE